MQNGETVLMLAAKEGHRALVELLLDQPKANINSTDVAKGRTALHYAAAADAAEFVHFLVEKGADVALKDDSEETALHVAAWHGHHETATALVKHGAALDALNHVNKTPREVAIRRGHNALGLLLEPVTQDSYKSRYWYEEMIGSTESEQTPEAS
ncbi:hypothetical protein CYMTET_54794 [Cymbomonas tetramitiformis]|uniref:Uncharacterized protein n=1 Tax=Cymbomonas tetramitiformis TaxID=36881 RepID=A0AAE0EP75_9CHLO|nr:hypothetical protein CYMTET_54794 [Cymbomonas tetramitiformis]